MTKIDPRITRSRSLVIGCTVELLAERGVEATTIDAISERTGVAKTTIYRHWDSKADLVIDAIESLAEVPPDPDTGTFGGDLAALAVGLAHGLGSGPWATLLPSLIDAAQRDPSLADLHERFTETRHDTVRAIVARARLRGEIDREFSDDDIIALIAGPIVYQLLIGRRVPDVSYAVRLAAMVVQLVAVSSDV